MIQHRAFSEFRVKEDIIDLGKKKTDDDENEGPADSEVMMNLKQKFTLPKLFTHYKL